MNIDTDKLLTIEPGKTYALEMPEDVSVDPMASLAMREAFARSTGATLIILPPGFKLVRMETASADDPIIRERQGIAAVIGKWPSDETDEQIEQALKELS